MLWKELLCKLLDEGFPNDNIVNCIIAGADRLPPCICYTSEHVSCKHDLLTTRVTKIFKDVFGMHYLFFCIKGVLILEEFYCSYPPKPLE